MVWLQHNTAGVAWEQCVPEGLSDMLAGYIRYTTSSLSVCLI